MRKLSTLSDLTPKIWSSSTVRVGVDSLCSDLRFQGLLRRMKFPE